MIVVGPVDVVVDVVIVVVVVIVVIVVVAVDIIKTTDVLFPVPRTALVCRQKHCHIHSVFDKCFISMQWSLSWTNRTRAAQMPVTCLAVWKRITAKYYSYILELYTHLAADGVPSA